MPYQLALIYDLYANGRYYLDGPNITVPVNGARYSPGAGQRSIDANGRELITEEITVDLAGANAQIRNWITQINALFEVKKAGAWRVPYTRLYLGVQDPDDLLNAYWYSEIFDAWMFLDPNGLAQRAAGTQRVTLKVTREDRWESTNWNLAEINFPGPGTNQSTAGYLLNHLDISANHTNWGWINKIANSGDLPNRAYIQFKCSQPGRSLGDAFLGCGWSDKPSPDVEWMLPTHQETDMTAGPAVTKTGALACAACAGGSYATFAWSPAAETLIFKTTLTQALYANNLSNGRPFKPFVRLHAGAAYSDVYFKAKVLVGPASSVLYETDAVLYQNNAPLIELPPVYVPPDGIMETSSIEVALYAVKSDAALRTFAVDYWQFWPVDGGFRKYKGIDYISGNGIIVDNPTWSQLFWTDLNVSARRAVYAGYGAPIQIHPAKTNVVALLHLAGGNTWAIDDQINLGLTVYPAKRNL